MAATKKILVVDDEKLIVKTTCILLRHMGYETLEAFDGESGIASARAHAPDLVLLDLNMPGIDGWEVLERLKGSPDTVSIPVVIFTAKDYANAETVNRIKGAAGHIRKPFDPDDLQEVIRRLDPGPERAARHGD